MRNTLLLVAFALVVPANAAVIALWGFNDGSFFHPAGSGPGGADVGTPSAAWNYGTTPGPNASVGTGLFTTTAQAGYILQSGVYRRVGLGSQNGYDGDPSTWSNTCLSVGNGSGSDQALRHANNGSYIQFKTSTVGYGGIKLEYKGRVSSGTSGVTAFRTQTFSYSTNGTDFTTFATSNPVAGGWGAAIPASSKVVDFSAVTALNNQPEVTIRITFSDPGIAITTATAYQGYSYFDDMSITGSVADQVLTGTLGLNDTVFGAAFGRNIAYSLMQGTTTVVSGTITATASSTPLSISVPSSVTGATQLILDGSSFLKRVINLNMTGSSQAIGTAAMQNGDVDNSGEVDAVDIDQVIAAFGSVANTDADVDVSGEVDAVDIDIVIANFGGIDN